MYFSSSYRTVFAAGGSLAERRREPAEVKPRWAVFELNFRFRRSRLVSTSSTQGFRYGLMQSQTTFSDMPAQGRVNWARKGLLPETIRCGQGFQAWLVKPAPTLMAVNFYSEKVSCFCTRK